MMTLPDFWKRVPGDFQAGGPAVPLVCYFVTLHVLLLLAGCAENASSSSCVNNLRIIQGAKDQFALEYKLKAGEAFNPESLAPYLKSNKLPRCPEGGRYAIGPVDALPTCSLPRHFLATNETAVPPTPLR